MPKKSAQTMPTATISPEILAKHPLTLTRASNTPIVSGEYTLDSLRSTFGIASTDETGVLLALAQQGQAFFKQDGSYFAFNPKQGDLDFPIDSEETIEASVDDPDGEGEPDYSDLVEEEREELATRPDILETVEPKPVQTEPVQTEPVDLSFEEAAEFDEEGSTEDDEEDLLDL